jgi:hypothetical protein
VVHESVHELLHSPAARMQIRLPAARQAAEDTEHEHDSVPTTDQKADLHCRSHPWHHERLITSRSVLETSSL